MSPILRPYIPSQHALSLQCGIIQLLILVIIESITLRTSPSKAPISKHEGSKAHASIRVLEQQLATQREELSTTTSHLHEKSQELEIANGHIEALKQQLATQQKELSTTTSHLHEKSQEAEAIHKHAVELVEVITAPDDKERIINLTQTLAMQKALLAEKSQETKVAKERIGTLEKQLQETLQDKETAKEEVEQLKRQLAAKGKELKETSSQLQETA